MSNSLRFPPESMHQSAPFLLLISAPSGAGKTTVSQGLMNACPGIGRIITCTSRAPRPGEVDGVDYHFFSRADFEERIAAGQFLEHANVYGDWKGILKASVRAHWATGRDALLSVDVQGAETIRRVVAADPALAGRLVTVFITPGSRAELEARLRGRDADAPEAIARRLDTAEAEVSRWAEFDYLLVSRSREEDLDRLRSIYQAERCRSSRQGFRWETAGGPASPVAAGVPEPAVPVSPDPFRPVAMAPRTA
jgi:guanylate kinase